MIAQLSPSRQFPPGLRNAGSTIPHGTPVEQLRRLLARYRSGTDPVVAATPPTYRLALIARIGHLLGSATIPEPAR